MDKPLAEDFIRAQTVPARPALVPEVELYLATEITPIWKATETWLEAEGVEPPFWAFAWPGSQALARLVLDEPARVAGRRVLDFAAGGGLAAIACHRAGATSVEAAELDPLACAAIRLNARHNGADSVRDVCGDVVGAPGRWDVILAGDVCYEAPMTRHILPWLRGLAAGGAEVWLADPGRAYLPREALAPGPRYTVPVTRELEDRDTREVTVWRVLPPEQATRPAASPASGPGCGGGGRGGARIRKR
ncbi:MAG: 50S ribosomal protein L11 methyltransferase [Roseomonas mucosa]|nr:50S ribosomal protein L11 methyltransferase [Roseomonas mucosa]